jgi:hypothetical protein
VTTALTRPGRAAAAAKPKSRRSSRRDSRRISTRTGLRACAAAIVVLVVALGAVATLGPADRSAATQDAATHAEPLSVAAQDVYRDLSDTDATAADVFLSGAQSGAAEQQRYDTDVHQVSAGLASMSADAGSSPALRAATAEILADLPVYTNLIGTAQADGRQNLPVGAAYLREASGLMRAKLIPAAQQAMTAETDRVAADDAAVAPEPTAEFAVLGAALIGLCLVQIFVLQRTHRLVNPGIAAATLIVLAVTLWTGLAVSGETGSAAAADGHQQNVDALAATEQAVIRAHGDELLSLAARGEDHGTYDTDFTATSTQLTRLLAADHGPGIADATSTYGAWLTDHTTLVQLETQPQADNSANLEALALLTQSGPGTSTGAGSGADFARMDADLRSAVAGEQTAYLTAIDAGHADLDGLAVGAALLAAAALAAGAFGANQRLREYR